MNEVTTALSALVLAGFITVEGELKDLVVELGLDWPTSEDWWRSWVPPPVVKLDLNRAGVDEVAAVSGGNMDWARAVVEERRRRGPFRDLGDFQRRMNLSDREARAWEGMVRFGEAASAQFSGRVRADGRFGREAADELRRYYGSRTGITQAYRISGRNWRGGVTLDKDRYEPDLADLARYYGVWESAGWTAAAGDFHVNQLSGVALATEPRFIGSYGQDAAYSTPVRLRAADDTRQNAGFRGAAVERSGGRFRGGVFGAVTALDAIRDDQGKVQRLSDGGYHRSPGESRKRNTLRETAGGGWGVWRALIGGAAVLELGAAGYCADWSPSLTPPPDRRDPHPLAGRGLGVVGVGGAVQWRNGEMAGEIGADDRGNRAGRAVLRTLRLGAGGSVAAQVYHFPPGWRNPRGAALPGGGDPTNRTGGAVLVRQTRRSKVLQEVKVHFGYERRPERTWTIPKPSWAVQGSVEADIREGKAGWIGVKYRRREGLEGEGEQAPPVRYEENRLRIQWRWVNAPTGRCDFGVFQETAGRRAGGRGWVWGGCFGGKGSFRVGRLWLLSVSLAGYSSGRGLGFYLGEVDLAGRVASVPLYGAGWRWTAAATWRVDSRWELGAKAARTVRRDRPDRPGDWEVYATAAWAMTVTR